MDNLVHLAGFLNIFVFTFLAYVANIDAARILAAYVFPGKSHFMMHTALIKEIILRGHEVTCITSFTLEKEDLGKNYTEILIEPQYEFWPEIMQIFQLDNIFDFAKLTNFEFLYLVEFIGVKTTEHALKQPKVQEIINSSRGGRNAPYDLFLAEQFFQEAFLAFAHKFNIPVVTSATLDFSNYMSQMMGIIMPWSFVPHGFLPYDDHMNFHERLTNSFYSLYEDMRREYVYFPQQDELVKKYFSNVKVKIPKVTQMEKNISVILVNSYVPSTTSRPMALGMIPVGGLHINPPKALPADMQNFLDSATSGAIYFSLGTQVRSADMPPEKIQMFLNVFASLKQHVLWKFEDENIPKLPSNVMVKKWMPQSDILAHRNVKVFITHGGLFGTQEAIYYAVPMLGIPVYCDQHLNMNKAAKNGYAIKLHFPTIARDSLMSALSALLEDPSYRTNIKRVSKIFRDRPLSAKDTAMYWIEYVIRHKGARHLRSAGLDLKWYEFYLLDVIAFVAAGVLTLVLLLSFGIRWLVFKVQTVQAAKLKET